jgi:hypothetical protein
MCGDRSIVVAAQMTQNRFNKLLRQYAMIQHDSDPPVNLSKPLKKQDSNKGDAPCLQPICLPLT